MVFPIWAKGLTWDLILSGDIGAIAQTFTAGFSLQRILLWVPMIISFVIFLIAMFADAKSPGLLAFMILLAVVIAPITEELLFRAGIFRYVRTRLPRWAALLIPSVLFGALHANLASFAPLVALGVVFSLAYARTGRIATTIVAHGLFNLNTIVLIFSGVTA
jgi:membrane protease YdiL (CAAX protease family)